MQGMPQTPEFDDIVVPPPQPPSQLMRRDAIDGGMDDDIDAHAAAAAAASQLLEVPMNYSLGVTSILIAAAVSGLTSVYFEKILKDTRDTVSIWVRNTQMSFYSMIAAFIGGVLWQDGSDIAVHGFFEGYNWVVWTAILLQAFGGIVASLVIRDTDNIVKTFATSISIVISFLISVYLFDDFGFTLTVGLPPSPRSSLLNLNLPNFGRKWLTLPQFLIGTSLVLLATYLYSLPDRRIGRIGRIPPPIRIASFEKPAIERVHTPRAMPNTPDPFAKWGPAGTGLAVSTSRPSSPMLPRQNSRQFLKRDD